MALLVQILGIIVAISGLAWFATTAGASPTIVFAVAMVTLGVGIAVAFLQIRLRRDH